MTYSKDNQIRKYVKGYEFMSFAKNFGSKFGKKFLSKGISASKRITENQGSEFSKIAGKKIVQKYAEATGDLIGSKIADKITSLKVKDKPQEIIEEEINIPPEKETTVY